MSRNPYDHPLPPSIEDVDVDLSYAEAALSDGLGALRAALRALGTSDWLDLHDRLRTAVSELQEATAHLTAHIDTCARWADRSIGY